MCAIVDLVMGDTRKFFHDCNCIFTVHVQHAYVILEGDVRSLPAPRRLFPVLPGREVGYGCTN